MAQRKTTSRDVALRAGVSRTTVSYVLNNVETANISGATRTRVLNAAQALNYVPNAAARMLAGQRSQIIGLVFPRVHPHLSTHLYLLQILEGVLDVVHQHDMRLLLDSVENSVEDAYMNLMRSKHIDGLLLIDVLPSGDRALDRLAADGLPVVSIGRIHPDICSVDVDTRSGARRAVEHLLFYGHTRIACITNCPYAPMDPSDRIRGYRDALASAGIAYDSKFVRNGRYSPESGFAAMNDLLDVDPLPTAVFVASDVVAFGAMHSIQARNLTIPEDIAIIGFDDVSMAQYMNPPLSSVRIPAVEQGRKAGEMLIDLIMKRETASEIVLEAELVPRASTANDR